MKLISETIPDWAETITLTLLQSLKERDPYTYGHCRRVARYARLLAQAAGLSTLEQTIIEHASLFHDIGKIGIPDHILLKPGKLTKKEETIMRLHPQKSADIVRPLIHIPFFGAMLPGILHHHERIDGGGYPDGIRSDAIPLSARVILIADTFDAMTSTRPYRKARDTATAYKELKLFSGRQFDPQLVQTFVHAHPKWEAMAEEMTDTYIAQYIRRPA